MVSRQQQEAMKMSRSWLRTGTVTLVVLALGASMGLCEGRRMWYRGYFEGPVTARNNPQPGYYYQPSPDATRPLFEESHGYPMICEHCRAYYYPGETRCPRCDGKLPGKKQGVDSKTVYSPYQMPGQYYYKEQPHYSAITATRNLGSRYMRYRYRWDRNAFDR